MNARSSHKITRRSLREGLLTGDLHQQIRLAQSGLATMLMLACVVVLNTQDRYGIANHRWVALWTAMALGGMAAIFVVIRSGWVVRWRDPSLTMLQMFYAISCAAFGYSIGGSERGVVIPVLTVILMFGMFGMTQRQVVVVGAFTLAVFGAVSAPWLLNTPPDAVPVGEATRLMMIGIVVTGTVVLTGRLHKMRERSRSQRAELRLALDRIQVLATRDELTGCLNRHAMRERLIQESQRCARTGEPWCVAMLDLDHFKLINDALGHAIGDQVLRGFADAARDSLRETDVLARWGGEEFLLLLPASDVATAEVAVTRLLSQFAQTTFPGMQGLANATCSAGLTACHRSEDIDGLVVRADRALYLAKQSGRNRVLLG